MERGIEKEILTKGVLKPKTFSIAGPVMIYWIGGSEINVQFMF